MNVVGFGAPNSTVLPTEIVTASEQSLLFAEWEPDISYTVGQLRRYGDTLYRCVQAHTFQTDWTPPAAPVLGRSPAIQQRNGLSGLSPSALMTPIRRATRIRTTAGTGSVLLMPTCGGRVSMGGRSKGRGGHPGARKSPRGAPGCNRGQKRGEGRQRPFLPGFKKPAP